MNKRKGFTLVELLTVIAIIVLLVSIFSPSLQNVKQPANSICCQYNPRNDITFSPVELILVSQDSVSGRPTIVGKFLVWEQIPENPDPYDNYDMNVLICNYRCAPNTCLHRHCWISHTCINPSEDNTEGILTDFLINKIDQKQSAQ